jgi:hypothetical protein
VGKVTANWQVGYGGSIVEPASSKRGTQVKTEYPVPLSRTLKQNLRDREQNRELARQLLALQDTRQSEPAKVETLMGVKIARK